MNKKSVNLINSLGDFVVFWNYDSQTVFHTTELSTNSLRILWCFGIMISTPFSPHRSFQPIPLGILWCFGIMIAKPFSIMFKLDFDRTGSGRDSGGMG